MTNSKQVLQRRIDAALRMWQKTQKLPAGHPYRKKAGTDYWQLRDEMCAQFPNPW